MVRDGLDDWCLRHLGSAPAHVLFRTGHLGVVQGIRLADGREVVVKARPPSPRLDACVAVQATMAERGFPCPKPLAGPAPLGDAVATAETHVPGGEPLSRRDLVDRSAGALARLVALAPAPSEVGSLDPPPPWAWWDHDRDGSWPEPDEGDPLLDAPESWIDEAALRVRMRLASLDLPPVVGHADWWSGNVLWREGRVHVVHDWDSVAARPEAAIAGAAAAMFAVNAAPGNEPDVAESDAFMTAYERERGVAFSAEEREVAWAAGLWVRLYDAKKESVADPRGDGPIRARLRPQLPSRLRAAGL